MQRSISLDQSFKVQEVTLQLRSVRGGISLADLVCLGSCCWPFGNQTWLGTSSFISDVPLISLPPKKGFTHRRSAFGTDSGDSYGQPRSWKIHLGRRLTCWKVGDRCGDLFDRKKIEVTFSLFYMISDICWYLWKPCGVWSICENTRLFPALFRVSRSVYRNPPSKSINKSVWTVWTRKFYLEPSAKMGFIQIYKSKNRSNVRLNKTESFSFFLKHVSQSLISGAAQGYYLFPCSG